jgi:hypothetical protein
MKRYSEYASFILIALAVGIFLAVAIPKILYPYEMHWMEGTMLEQVNRILNGKPLYAKPSIYYVPWLYEPLYYYVTELFALVSGLSYPLARIPSVLSTIGVITIIYFVVRKETGRAFYGIAGIGLYLASFGKVEYSFIAARIDPLFNLLLVSSIVIVYYSKRSRSILTGAALLALCYFTKQTALVFAPAFILYFIWIGQWKSALVFFAGLAICIFGGILLLDSAYHGYFSYYTLLVPKAKGTTLRWSYAFNGLFSYVIIRCWLISFIALAMLFLKKSFHSESTNLTNRDILYFGFFLAASLVSGFLGILNFGGGHNVFLPIAALAAIFLPIASQKLQHTKFALLFIPIQIMFLLSMPWRDPRNIAREIDKKNQEVFFAKVSSLPGEVWIRYHGFNRRYTGKADYADIAAIKDILLIKDSDSYNLQAELDSALLQKKWSYIISDVPDTINNYIFDHAEVNLNKVHINDDTMLYIYKPRQ